MESAAVCRNRPPSDDRKYFVDLKASSTARVRFHPRKERSVRRSVSSEYRPSWYNLGDGHVFQNTNWYRGETVIRDLLSRWPVIRQIQNGSDGTGWEAMSQRTRDLLPKAHGAEVTRSICPYCGVGCGQLVYHKDGKLISIEGDPESPI